MHNDYYLQTEYRNPIKIIGTLNTPLAQGLQFPIKEFASGKTDHLPWLFTSLVITHHQFGMQFIKLPNRMKQNVTQNFSTLKFGTYKLITLN